MKRQKAASIKDIAQKAGVSISTVSYALNGSAKLTDETTNKVLSAARELNYTPNAAARTLKKQESRILGAFLTAFDGDVFGEMLDGMKDVCYEKGYDLIVCSGKQSHRLLSERMIDGAIILDDSFDSGQLLEYAERAHKLVVLDRELEHPNIRQVLLDNKAGATLAVEHLVERGHRKIYIVTGPETSFDATQRMKGVHRVAERNPDVEWIEIPGDFMKSGGVRAAERILDEYNGPAAVFCLNDEMAVGFYNRMAKTELSIGKDIHLVGFDNIELAGYIQPRLTTIDYSKRKWGELAAEQLIGLLQGKAVEHERVYVRLEEAESVGRAENPRCCTN
ncbi:LacI family transcriptional regulator [Saccharibacillus sp. O16]|nr:LacI family transcriptional regulator [Saccharibacillus sp. O16]